MSRAAGSVRPLPRAMIPVVDVEAAQVFTSLLALVAGGGAMVLLIARTTAARSPMLRRALDVVDDAALWLAFLVAATATAGSLYFSEVADYTPCRLCWFQRIAMYPLAVILLVAAIRRDRNVRWYVLPIAVIGSLVSAYHYLVEWRPSLEGGACGVGPSCADVWFRQLGFVTLSFMALSGFLAILVLVMPNPQGTPLEASEQPEQRDLQDVVSQGTGTW